MHLKVGDRLTIEGLVTKFSLKEKTITVTYPGIGSLDYGYEYYPFQISPLGEAGFMPPYHLPFHNTSCVTHLASDMTCTLMRTQKKCRLAYADDFAYTGQFTLTELDGANKHHCTSQKWNYKVLKDHIVTLVNSQVLEAVGTISYIYDSSKDVYHKEIYSNKIIRKRVKHFYVFLTFPDESLAMYPLAVIMKPE